MLGRLLIVGVRGAIPGDPQLEADLQACEHAGVGGVILFDIDAAVRRRDNAMSAPRNILGPQQLRELIGYMRQRLGPQTWVCVDQEGGQVARLSPKRGFAEDPSAVEFARLDAPSRKKAARHQARQLADLGFDMNFAPCVDLAFPDNPIISRLDRALGRLPQQVIEAATTILEEHARAGVAACLKHFPGHGSSLADTHVGAVDITETWQPEELEPYRTLCGRDGVAVMVAHVLHRRLDAQLPASLSRQVIETLLRGEIGFEGVVVTDSIDMGAIADRWSPGEATVAAVSAGADLVIDGFNHTERVEHPAPAMVAALQKAMHEGRLSEARIEQSLARLERLRAQISGAA